MIIDIACHIKQKLPDNGAKEGSIKVGEPVRTLGGPEIKQREGNAQTTT